MGCCGTSGIQSSKQVQLVQLADDERCLFDIRVLRDLLEQWLADHPSGRATRDEFAGAVHSLNVDGYVIDGIMDTLDADGEGAINFQDAIFALSTFLQGGARDRLNLLFAVLDRDHNGNVSKSELRDALACQRRAVSSRSSAFSSQLNNVVDDVFTTADLDHDGSLSFEEFQLLVGQSPELEQHFAVADAVQRFNDCKTGWSGRYEAVRVLAIASKLNDGAQENSEDLWDVPGPLVAEVLDESIGLSPTAIGDFLAHKDTLGPSPEFARCYFSRLDFKGMTPDKALRQASARLCFPREAQQVDRLITAFAWAYSQSNPEICMDEDTVSIVSYAILMLNSDAHGENVRSKMTCSEFVANTLQAVPGVRQEQLEGIYERVQKEEIRLGRAGGILACPSNGEEPCSESVVAALGQLVNDELGTVLRGMRNRKFLPNLRSDTI